VGRPEGSPLRQSLLHPVFQEAVDPQHVWLEYGCTRSGIFVVMAQGWGGDWGKWIVGCENRLAKLG
jgi:hypothetical protein